MIHEEPPLDTRTSDHLKNTLDQAMARYEANTPKTDRKAFFEKAKLWSEEERQAYVTEQLKDPKAIERFADIIMISFCAQHFYGLDSEDFDRMSDLITAIRNQGQ